MSHGFLKAPTSVFLLIDSPRVLLWLFKIKQGFLGREGDLERGRKGKALVLRRVVNKVFVALATAGPAESGVGGMEKERTEVRAHSPPAWSSAAFLLLPSGTRRFRQRKRTGRALP